LLNVFQFTHISFYEILILIKIIDIDILHFNFVANYTYRFQ